MTSDQQFLAAINRISDQLPSDATMRTASIAPSELCNTYHGIEGDIKALLPAVALIPIYGGAISGALGVLKNIADALCPNT